MTVPGILFGALWTGVTCLALGLLIIQALRFRLYRTEIVPVAGLLGSAALSSAVFFSLTLWIAKPWFFLAIGLGGIAVCIWRRAWRVSKGSAPNSLPAHWRWILTAGLLVYGVFTLAHAMAPETSPDGVAYHLGTVGRYLRQGGFEWYTRNMYANLPMGIEMLFLFAYAFGRHSAAALVHWELLLILPFVVLACGRRFGAAPAGAAAALFTFISPVVAIDGASAYVDTGTAAVVSGMFLLLMIWEQERSRGLLIAAGLLAGFAYACKMTAAPAVLFAIGFVAWVLWRSRQFSARPIAVLALSATVMVAPWLAKNTLMVGNPFSPFLNRLFPNPYVRISFEEMYRASYRDYYGQIKTPWAIPLEVTVRGGILNGLLGPVFLVTPLALFALRWPLGRRAWAAAACMAVTYPGNIGTRFLISSVPFVSLALGLVLSNWRGMAASAVLFHAFASWPDTIMAYSDPYAWRLDRFRWKQALRIEPEDGYLSRMVGDYRMARLADELVPADGHIFTFGGIAEAYTSRDVSVAYQAGLNNAAGEIFATGVANDMVAAQAIEFHFPARHVRRVRLVQTAATPQIWSVSEMRALSPAHREYPRAHWWRVRAQPNPWDVQWAFDNCPVTRWKAWQSSSPGEYLEIDFIQPVELGGIRAELSIDQPATHTRVDVQTSAGKWETAADSGQTSSLPPPPNVRRTATDDLKRLGFTHLVVNKDEFLSDDVARNTDAWGLTLLAVAGNASLYRIN